MDKEEILAKSREDKSMDERMKQLQGRQSVVMVSAMMGMWVLLCLWDFIRGVDTSAMSAVAMSGITAMCVWQFYQFRMKSALFFGAFAVVGAIGFAAEHIMGTL